MDISILGRQMYAIKQVIRFADDQEDKKGQIASFFCPSRGRWKENVPPRGGEAETRQGQARQGSTMEVSVGPAYTVMERTKVPPPVLTCVVFRREQLQQYE